MEDLALLGSVTGLGLMSGLRLYATVLAVGLGVRFGLVHLDPGVAHLAVLASTPILLVAGIAYFFEFLADKIPWIDSLGIPFTHSLDPSGRPCSAPDPLHNEPKA